MARTGRPPAAGVPRAEEIRMRVTRDELSEIDRAAGEFGRSEWIRQKLEEAICPQAVVTINELRQNLPELLAQLEAGKIDRLVVTREKINTAIVFDDKKNQNSPKEVSVFHGLDERKVKVLFRLWSLLVESKGDNGLRADMSSTDIQRFLEINSLMTVSRMLDQLLSDKLIKIVEKISLGIGRPPKRFMLSDSGRQRVEDISRGKR